MKRSASTNALLVGAALWASATAALGHSNPPTIKLSPSVRSEQLAAPAPAAADMHALALFLVEPLVMDHNMLEHAARIVASETGRSMLVQGDLVYASGSAQVPLVDPPTTHAPRSYRVFRQARPITDPVTREVLAYEAQYIGQAHLLRSEAAAPATQPQHTSAHQPATLRISQATEEIHLGDRLLPEPQTLHTQLMPHAPATPVQAQVLSLYGSAAMRHGAQHQVITINKGRQDGLQPGALLRLQSSAAPALGEAAPVQLPTESNGHAMVLRSFERIAYALIMDTPRGVQVGDTLTGGQ